MEPLVRGTSQEAEFQDKSKHSREDEGEGGPGSGGAEALCQGFDDNDKNIEAKHEEQAVGNEDTSSSGGRSEDMLDVKRRQDRAEAKDKEEQKKLEDGGYRFFHGWTLEIEFSAAVGIAGGVSTGLCHEEHLQSVSDCMGIQLPRYAIHEFPGVRFVLLLFKLMISMFYSCHN
jgi:hypothetical protein